jgi:hypothetical protein
MSTTAAPRFKRTSPRGHELEVSDPLPSSLAALVEERAEQHKRVAARVSELRAKRVELAQQLAQQEQADQKAAAEAALTGKSPGRRQRAAKLRGQLEEAEHDLQGFGTALAHSADSLLSAALPFAGKAAEKATESREAALTRLRELLAAADAAAEDVARFSAQLAWLTDLDGQHRVDPYRESLNDPDIQRLRVGVSGALGEYELKRQEKEAEAARWRAYEEEEEAEYQRHAERIEAEAAAARVRYEGMRLTHRGGKPVGPSPFHDPGEEQSQ